jgi:hypothetical protein
MKNRSHSGEVIYETGRIKEGSSEGEYWWCTFYVRMNIEFLNLLKSP